jgi:VanZ family protein
MVRGLDKKNKFLFYWLPLIIWILGIFFISSLPSNFFPESKILKYPLHPIAFFVLFLLFYRVFRLEDRKVLARDILLISFVFTMIISVFKECWQIFIPTRSFSLKDILIDEGAALLALIVVMTRRVVKVGIKSDFVR